MREKLFLDQDRRPGEDRVRVALSRPDRERAVRSPCWFDQWRALIQGGDRIDDRGQDFVLDREECGGVCRAAEAVCRYHGDWLPDVGDSLFRKKWSGVHSVERLQRLQQTFRCVYFAGYAD